jgi:hypothetical protein
MAKTYTLPTSGTVSIPVDASTAYPDFVHVENIATGTVTLVGPLAISPSGTPTAGQKVLVTWNASVTTTGVPITIFGETVPDQLSTKNFIAECIYTGVAWVVNILTDFAGTGIVSSRELANDAVSTAKVADDAITNAKLANITRGSIKVGGASDAPTDLDAKTSGQILVGDGTDVVSVAVSGDATLSSAGALTIVAGVIEGDAAASAGDRNIAAATIEPSNLTAGARKDSFSIRLDFDDASKLGGQIFLPVCYNCTVDAVKATLVGAAGSDLTVIIKDAFGSVMTGSQIDVPSATVVGNVITSTVTGNNTMTGGTNMILEPSAAGTLAGHIHLTFCVTRDN